MKKDNTSHIEHAFTCNHIISQTYCYEVFAISITIQEIRNLLLQHSWDNQATFIKLLHNVYCLYNTLLDLIHSPASYNHQCPLTRVYQYPLIILTTPPPTHNNLSTLVRQQPVCVQPSTSLIALFPPCVINATSFGVTIRYIV